MYSCSTSILNQEEEERERDRERASVCVFVQGKIHSDLWQLGGASVVRSKFTDQGVTNNHCHTNMYTYLNCPLTV